MNLVCGVKYELSVPMPSGKRMIVTMEYCGGSMVDSLGHQVYGGIWARDTHPNYTYWTVNRADTYNRKYLPPGTYVVPGSGRAGRGEVWGDDGKVIQPRPASMRQADWIDAHERNLRRHLRARMSRT